jgi:hypothetical protein
VKPEGDWRVEEIDAEQALTEVSATIEQALSSSLTTRGNNEARERCGESVGAPVKRDGIWGEALRAAVVIDSA